MFKKAGKKTSKVLAYLLALMIMVGYFPSTLIMNAMAADGDTVDYTIMVTDGSGDPLEGAEIVIKKDDAQVGETLETNADGEATAEGLDDATEYSYTVTLLGYEDATSSFTTDSATDPKEVNVTMTALEEATITGTVTDGTAAYEGATVTLSGYSEASDTTDENGEYALTGYVGKEYTVTVTPKSGDEAKYSVAERTFTPDAADYDLATIDLSVATYKVSAAEGITNGSVKFYSDEAATAEITGTSLDTIPYGTDITVKVEAVANYRVAENSFSVTGYDGAALDNEGKYTFKVKEGTTVTAAFEQYLFEVTDTSSTQNTIVFTSGVTDGKAEKGSNITYTITPPTNYCIDTLTIVNGSEPATIDEAANKEVSYNGTLEGVAGDIEFNATFKAITYTVTLNITGNGTINYNSNPVAGGSIGNINKGTNLSFDVIADSANGYHIQKIESSDYNVNENEMSVSGVGTIGENDCTNKTVTIPSISKAGTVTIEFAVNTYTVNVDCGENGAAKIKSGINADNTTVNYGGTLVLEITPDNKYDIQTITVNGVDKLTVIEESGEDYILTIENVTSSQDIDVSFATHKTVTGEFDKISNDYYIMKFYDGNDAEITNVDLGELDGKDVIVLPKGSKVKIKANDTFTSYGKAIKINTTKPQNNYVSLIEFSESKNLSTVFIKKGGTASEKYLLNVNVQVIIDNTAPEITLATPASITTNTEATIKFSVNDDYSPLEKVIYSTVDNYANVTADNCWDAVAGANGEYSFTLTEEQNKTYYIYATDTAGNVSEAKTVNVVIDKTAPKIKDVAFSGENNSDTPNIATDSNGNVIISSTKAFNMTVTANDVTEITEGEGGSAITTPVVSAGLKNAVITYKQNNESKEPISIGFTNDTVTQLIPEGTYTDVYVTVYDNADNPSEKKGPYTLVVDNSDFKTTENSVIVNALDGNKKHETADKIWFANEKVQLEFALTHTNQLVKASKVVVSVNDAKFTCIDENNDGVYTCNFIKQDDTSALNTGENKVEITVTASTGKEAKAGEVTFYIDQTPAEIVGFEFKRINNDPANKIINFLTFGNFFNEKVAITVTAADAGAGVKTITLFAGDEEFTQYVVADNKATFTVPVENVSKYEAAISAIATDNVDNQTETEVLPTTTNSETFESSGLMIETIDPIINVAYPSEPANQNEKTATAGEWYDGDIDFAIDIEDADSGIRSVVISINGETLVDKIYKENDKDIEEHEATFNVSTSQVKANTDGSYKLEVAVIDNAGNEKNIEPIIVYKDTAAPYITKFAFEGTGYKESDETKAVAQITDYGFYFTADTKVTVYAEDAVDADGKKVPTAGIKEIICYTQAVNQTEKVKVTDITVNADGTYSFTIKAGFKGQIFAEVNDNVGNGSGICSPDKAVVESQEQHNAATEAHVAFSVPETTVKTASGSPLYKETVPVSIVVTDTFAGIRKIEWSVTSAYDTTNNQTGSIELANVINTAKGGVYEGWKVDEKENNLVTVMSKTIDVANNSNDIVVKVTMTDRAGNTTTKEITFSIDKVAPMIDVTYDNNTPDADYDSFYKANRVATIVVTERNFNKDDVKIVIENTDAVIPALSEWVAVENKEDPDKTTYTATITYAADGDYAFDIDYNDRATNAAVYVVGEGVNNAPLTAEDFEKHEFTIDKTLPVVKVAYDNNKALNDNYYAAERTATITVTEHNFDKDRIVITGNATDNGKAVAFPAITGWSAKGDVYTTTINYKADAEYTFDIMITDKAGNIDDTYKEESFFVDKTVPEIEITGVANNSANNGKVAPVITYSDTNFTENGVTVTLTGVNKGGVDYSRGVTNVANGQTMSYENFKNVKDVDDIYTLTAKVVDKAGNETTKSITFSVNRFGSTYDLKTVKDYNNKYIQSMGDLVFTEINVNTLDLGTMRVKLTKNGTPSDLVMDKDFTVELAGGGGRWCTYTYTLKSDLFKDDGKYTLSFYSVDAAGNINENIDETKEAEVSFAVDKTKPVILPIDLLESERYEETVKTVTIEIKDNLLIKDVKIYLNDSEITYKADGSNYVIEIPESIDRQTLKVVAVDAAGNEHETTVKDFLVTTNEFVQFINNPTAVIATIAGVVAVGGGGTAGFVFLGKKKRR